jgi:hypothetical protein
MTNRERFFRALEGRPVDRAPFFPDITTRYQASRLTFLDFYRGFDWGLPVHMYDWFEERYGGGVEKVVATEGRERNVTWRTPRGDLSHRYALDAEGFGVCDVVVFRSPSASSSTSTRGSRRAWSSPPPSNRG